MTSTSSDPGTVPDSARLDAIGSTIERHAKVMSDVMDIVSAVQSDVAAVKHLMSETHEPLLQNMSEQLVWITQTVHQAMQAFANSPFGAGMKGSGQ